MAGRPEGVPCGTTPGPVMPADDDLFVDDDFLLNDDRRA